MSALGRIVAAAAVGGLVVGGLVGFFTASDGDPATLALDAVPIYLCPGEGEVGTLHRGDRVLVTGRSGDWLAVRNVRGSGERVFIRNAAIVPDSALDGLPEVDCDAVGTLAVATTMTTVVIDETTTTTTQAPGESTTTSSSPSTTSTSTTSTTSTSTTSTTATTSTTTTTTTAPDTTGPTMANAGAAPSKIWEMNGGVFPITCPAQNPRQSTVSVNVTDAGSGVSTVTATWNDPLGGHATAMNRSGSTYSLSFGNYPADTWDPTQLSPYEHVVTITLTAKDNNQNQTQTTVQVTVTEAGQCFE